MRVEEVEWEELLLGEFSAELARSSSAEAGDGRGEGTAVLWREEECCGELGKWQERKELRVSSSFLLPPPRLSEAKDVVCKHQPTPPELFLLDSSPSRA